MLVIRAALAALSLVVLSIGCAPREAPPTLAALPDGAAMERWQALNAEVSKLRAFLDSRIEFMESRRASLPDVERANLDAAETASRGIESAWRLATSSFLAGDVDAAVARGEQVRLEVRDALLLLGIKAD